MARYTLLLFGLAALLSPACKHDRDERVPPSVPQGHYFPQVKALVQAHCTISCHAPSQGLPDGMPVILETDEDIVAYAQGIKAAVADPTSMFNRRMPPPDVDSLSDAQVATIVAWYTAGGRTTDCGLNTP